MDTGIPKSTVNGVVKRDLHLELVRLVKAALTEDHNRPACCKRFLQRFTIQNLELHTMTLFMSLQIRQKKKVDYARVYVERSGFPKKFMVSGAVSNLGKTSLHFIEEGVKMNRYYYINEVLVKMLPEMHALSDGDFIFQQDGANCHNAHATTAYIRDLTSLSHQTGPQTPAT